MIIQGKVENKGKFIVALIVANRKILKITLLS